MKLIHSNAIVTLALLAILTLMGTGCAKTEKSDSKAEVRKAVLSYLTTRGNLNLDKMDVEVSNVVLKDNAAEADVTFKVKGTPQQAMSMHYTLHKGNAGWEVDKGASSSNHPATGAMGGATGGTGAGGMGGDGIGDGKTMAAPPGQMPPGHPAVGVETAPSKQTKPSSKK
jgi:hypothetical protein